MNEIDVARVVREYESGRRKFEALADAMRVLLGQLAADEGVPVDSVSGRAKDQASLSRKLKNPKYGSLNDITDLCGLRIVVRHAEDVRAVVELLRQEFDVLEHVVHGAESPESFGYSSEHLILKIDARRAQLREWKSYDGLTVEVQVRSILQHAWASISHGLDYKNENEAPVGLRRQLFRIAALLETSDELFDSFRREMLRTRGSYKEYVSQDRWLALPLNIDSFRASEFAWPWRTVVETAINAGFRTDGFGIAEQVGSIDFWLEYVGETDQASGVKRLVRVGQTLEMETLGQLRGAVDDLSRNMQVLENLVHESEARGGAPYPVPADVLTLFLLATNSSERAFAVLENEDGLAFADHLMDSARAIAFSA